MDKKRWIFCLLLLPVISVCRAQISMSLQVPPVGVLMKNQLWNMVLINAGNSNVMVRVNLVLLDEKNNQPVLTGRSSPLSLGKGARQVQARDIGPIQYEYSGPAYTTDRDPNGLLPVGSYQVCYSVQNIDKGDAFLTENCIQLNVDPLSPPLLHTPSDEARIYNFYPQFAWLPPTPLGIFNNLRYDLILVEIFPGQGKADAIQQNVPVYSAGYVKDLFLNYPSSYRALDTSKTYAWRIVAINNGQAVSMSDIWTFRVASNKPVLKKREDPYIELKRGSEVSVASSGELLKLVYNNPATDTLLKYSIISLEDPGNPVVQQGQVSLKYGNNFLQISLPRSNGYSERKVYVFSFVNGRNESWKVKFTWSASIVENIGN
jgi:hypothetical protein